MQLRLRIGGCELVRRAHEMPPCRPARGSTGPTGSTGSKHCSETALRKCVGRALWRNGLRGARLFALLWLFVRAVKAWRWLREVRRAHALLCLEA